MIVATTVGTTMADFADRSLGIGYLGGTLILPASVRATLGLWRFSVGSVSVDDISTPGAKGFYWATILFSNTLGTALGDYLADGAGLGFEGGALVFAAVLVLVAAAYFYTSLSRATLFWLAFILTRPLGATVGDLLDKPVAAGGFNLSRITASVALAPFIVAMVAFTQHRAGRHPGEQEQGS